MHNHLYTFLFVCSISNSIGSIYKKRKKEEKEQLFYQVLLVLIQTNSYGYGVLTPF